MTEIELVSDIPLILNENVYLYPYVAIIGKFDDFFLASKFSDRVLPARQGAFAHSVFKRLTYFYFTKLHQT